MGALEIIVRVIYLLICLAIIAIVLLQTGRSAGISGAISGGAETFFGKNKARSQEGMLKSNSCSCSFICCYIYCS